jgi:molybdopterin converting factor small subunit
LIFIKDQTIEYKRRLEMYTCAVQLFGLPRNITDLRKVEIDLEEGMTLRDAVIALRAKIPALEGPVIRTGTDRLVRSYKFNVNGRFYYEDDMDLNLHAEDRVALLTPATGG